MLLYLVAIMINIMLCCCILFFLSLRYNFGSGSSFLFWACSIHIHYDNCDMIRYDMCVVLSNFVKLFRFSYVANSWGFILNLNDVNCVSKLWICCYCCCLIPMHCVNQISNSRIWHLYVFIPPKFHLIYWFYFAALWSLRMTFCFCCHYAQTDFEHILFKFVC